MWEQGLVTGSAGNVSRRADEHHIAITPTSVPYEQLQPEQIVIVETATGNAVESVASPSYELPMHRLIYRERPEVAAVVHTHAPFITTLSVLRLPLPPIIDEMLLHLGGRIEISEYAFTGTEEVGRNVLSALGDRAGAMLANHGNVCVGSTLERAFHAAVVMESCARVYVQALQVGEPLTIPSSAVEMGRRLFEERRR